MSVRELMVMVMCDPGTIVIDQGAEPISAPCLLILNVHGLCMLVCTCVYREYELAKCNTYLLSSYLLSND